MNEPIPAEFCRFPKRWDVVPFVQAVADATSGNAKIQQRDYQEEGALPVVDQGQRLVAGYTDDLDARCQEDLPALLFGDHTREFKFVDFPFVLGADGVKVLKPIADLDKRFLFHYLRQLRLPDDQGYSRHYKFLKRTFVPVPPLPEQKRIAAILDKADAVRRKRQEAIRLTEELLRSAFLEMFGDPVTNPKGWEVRKLSSIATVTTGNTPSRANAENFGDVIEWIKTDNINTPGHYLTRADEGLSASGLALGRTAPEGSTLVTCIAGSASVIGNVALANREVAFNQQINAVTPGTELDVHYLYGVLLLSKRAVQRLSTGGMKGLVSKGRLSTLPVPIPPKHGQQRFARFFGGCLGAAERCSSAANGSATLVSSLTQRAFSGRL